jgi:hypothetical protein
MTGVALDASQAEGKAPELRLWSALGQCFEVLVHPGRVLPAVAETGTWGIPAMIIPGAAFVIGFADLLSRRILQGPSGVPGVIVLTALIGIALMILVRCSLAAFLLQNISAGLGKPVGFSKSFTIAMYSMVPLVVQFAVALIGSRLHLFSVAQWSLIAALPSLSTRFNASTVAKILGHPVHGWLGAVLSMISPAELWMFCILATGFAAVARVRLAVGFLGAWLCWAAVVALLCIISFVM